MVFEYNSSSENFTRLSTPHLQEVHVLHLIHIWMVLMTAVCGEVKQVLDS